MTRPPHHITPFNKITSHRRLPKCMFKITFTTDELQKALSGQVSGPRVAEPGPTVHKDLGAEFEVVGRTRRIPASLVSSLSARSQLPVCPRLPTPCSPLPLSLARASCVLTPAPTQQQDFHRLSIMGVIDTPAVKKTTMVKMFIALALVAMAVLFVVSTLPRREEGEGAIEHAFEEGEGV